MVEKLYIELDAEDVSALRRRAQHWCMVSMAMEFRMKMDLSKRLHYRYETLMRGLYEMPKGEKLVEW